MAKKGASGTATFVYMCLGLSCSNSYVSVLCIELSGVKRIYKLLRPTGILESVPSSSRFEMQDGIGSVFGLVV